MKDHVGTMGAVSASSFKTPAVDRAGYICAAFGQREIASGDGSPCLKQNSTRRVQAKPIHCISLNHRTEKVESD